MREPSTTHAGPVPVSPPPGLRAPRRSPCSQAADRSGEGLGVVWDGDHIHLAWVTAQAGHVPTLRWTRAIRPASFEAGLVDSGVPGLRQALSDACGSRHGVQIWTAVDSAGTLTNTIRVPAVRDSQLASVVLWTLRKDKSITAEHTALDFEVLRTIEQDGSRQAEVFAVVAPRDDVSELVSRFATVGHPLAGIAPNAIAFRNLLRFAWPDACQGPSVVVCVDDESTDILLVSGGKPLGTRSVRTGISSLRHALAQHLDVDVADPRVGAYMDALRGGALPPSLPGGDPASSAEEVFGWVRPAARRLVRNVQRALHGFEVDHGVGDNTVFLVSGRIVTYPLVMRFLGTQLGVQMHSLTDPARAFGLQPPGTTDSVGSPEDGHGRAAAIGLALAAAYTTGNLLFTFQDRLRERRRHSTERTCLGAAGAVLVALLCVLAYLQARIHGRVRECARLRTSLAGAVPDSEGQDLAALMTRLSTSQVAVRKLADVYYAPALIAELAALTAPPVHLLGVDVRLGDGGDEQNATSLESAPARTAAGRRAEALQAEARNSAAAVGGRQRPPTILVRGVIAGRRDQVDAELASYVLRLRQSPLLDAPVVSERRLEAVDSAYLTFGPKGADHMLFFGLDMSYRKSTESVPVANPPPVLAAGAPPSARVATEEAKP